MKCPKCSAEMEAARYTGIEIDRCTSCKGLWFNSGEFTRLVKDDWLSEYIDEGSAKIGRKTNEIQDIDCPECGTAMKVVMDENQPHIEYEQCPKDCGVFFDAGEFRDLANTTFWDKLKPPART